MSLGGRPRRRSRCGQSQAFEKFAESALFAKHATQPAVFLVGRVRRIPVLRLSALFAAQHIRNLVAVLIPGTASVARRAFSGTLVIDQSPGLFVRLSLDRAATFRQPYRSSSLHENGANMRFVPDVYLLGSAALPSLWKSPSRWPLLGALP